MATLNLQGVLDRLAEFEASTQSDAGRRVSTVLGQGLSAAQRAAARANIGAAARDEVVLRRGKQTVFGDVTFERPVVVPAGSIPQDRVTDLTTDLASKLDAADIAGKADDNAVVKLTTDQTVAGVKTFTSAPIVPDGSFTQAKVAGLTADIADKSMSVSVKDFGAKGNAVLDANGLYVSGTDDRTAIQAAHNEAVAKGKRLYFPKGVYYSSGSIVVTGSFSWQGDDATLYGNSALLVDAGTADVPAAEAKLALGYKATIAGLTFASAPAASIKANWYQLRLMGYSSVMIERCSFRNANEFPCNVTYSTDITVQNCKFLSCNKSTGDADGLVRYLNILNSTGVRVVDNYFTSTIPYVSESSFANVSIMTATVTDVEIARNRIYESGGIECYSAGEHLVIEDNRLENIHRYPIKVEESSNVAIRRNTIRNAYPSTARFVIGVLPYTRTYTYGSKVTRRSGFLIEDNIVDNCPQVYLIIVQGVVLSSVASVLPEGTTQEDVNAYGVRIRGNKLTNSACTIPVNLLYVNDAEVDDNIISLCDPSQSAGYIHALAIYERLSITNNRIKTRFVSGVTVIGINVGAAAGYSGPNLVVNVEKNDIENISTLPNSSYGLNFSAAYKVRVIRNRITNHVKELWARSGTDLVVADNIGPTTANSTIDTVNYVNVVSDLTGGGTTANRPSTAPLGTRYFDTTLGRPVWVKTAGTREVDTLTVTGGATAAGNVTVTLNGVAVNVAVLTTDDTAAKVATKIRAAAFSGWMTGGTGATVTFTKNATGTNTAPAFDGAATGVTATPAVTTAGVSTVWTEALGTDFTPSGTPGVVDVDSFAGANDDAKFLAALTYAAAQTRVPAVRLRAGVTTLANSYDMFTGMKVIGAGPQNAAFGEEVASGKAVISKIRFTGASGTSSLFKSAATINYVTFANLAFHGDTDCQIFQSTGNVYGGQFHNLDFYGCLSAFGNATNKFLMTFAHFTGFWTVNAPAGTQFWLGGSDNTLWMGGQANIGGNPSVAGAGKYLVELQGLSKTNVGYAYITANNGWRGLRTSGDCTGLTLYGGVYEGQNDGDPSYGNLIRCEGTGTVRIRDPFLAYGMTSPAGTEHGIVEVACSANGQVLLDGFTYRRDDDVAETVPVAYVSGGSLRVSNAMADKQYNAWTGLPRVQNAGGTLTNDSSVTVLP